MIRRIGRGIRLLFLAAGGIAAGLLLTIALVALDARHMRIMDMLFVMNAGFFCAYLTSGDVPEDKLVAYFVVIHLLIAAVFPFFLCGFTRAALIRSLVNMLPVICMAKVMSFYVQTARMISKRREAIVAEELEEDEQDEDIGDMNN